MEKTNRLARSKGSSKISKTAARRRRERKKLHPAEQYIDGVLSGTIVVGKLVRRAVERHQRDLKEGKKKGFYFDRAAAEFAIQCFSLFKHSKGEYAGQPFALSPWQQFIVWCIFGWMKASGSRRFTRAYVEIARKNGKSTFVAGIALILLALDGEAGAEIYSAATKKDQARIVFTEAQRMVKASPDLRDFIKSYRNNLNVPSTNSKMEPLSSDVNGLDGLNPHGATVDELHAHKTRELWDVLDTATGARLQALLFAITTAGFNQDGICFEVRTYGVDVLHQTVDDDSFFFFIAAIDDEDDWQDETCWTKANPNLGVSVQIDDLRAKAKRAKRSAAARNNFLIKHLDRWVQQAQAWLSIEKWDACVVSKEHRYTESNLSGHVCYGGLDLSQKTDLCAFVAVFPPADHTKKWRMVYRFWIPADRITERTDEGDTRYQDWKDAGLIRVAGEQSVDYEVILQEILEFTKQFDVQQIGFDPWSAFDMANRLTNAGVTMVEVPQNYRHLSEASKEFESMIVSQRIEQDGNKVFRWMVDNVAIKPDDRGNIVPVKPKDRRKKIDGVMAAVIALSRAIVTVPDGPSVYESEEGLRNL